MEELYEQIGSYMVTCADDKESLHVLVTELMPLFKQVNYAALDIDDLQETHDKLGLGAQAITILSNVVSIYRINTGKNISMLLGTCGLANDVIQEVEGNQNYIWIPGGLLLLGSGILANLRESLNDSPKRSDSN